MARGEIHDVDHDSFRLCLRVLLHCVWLGGGLWIRLNEWVAFAFQAIAMGIGGMAFECMGKHGHELNEEKVVSL